MTLAAAFAAYLRDRSTTPALAAALAEAGLPGHAGLLGRSGTVDGGLFGPQWTGRSCHLGPAPAAGAAPGDLWFDPAELTAMVLIPRPKAVYDSWPEAIRERMTPTVSWLAITPTEAWQVLGWAQVVGTSLDLADGRSPAAGLSGWQADQYATFFGKALANRHDWAAVAETDLADTLWPPDNGPELMGYIGEGEVLTLNRALAVVPDTDDEDEGDDDEDDGFLDDAEPLTGVAFRTHVSSQQGLLNRAHLDS